MKKHSKYIDKQGTWKTLYDSGMSFTQIGKQAGVHYTTVQRVLKDVITPRPKKKYDHLLEQWIFFYTKGELSINEIAEKFNVGNITVSRYLKDAGVELRRQYGQDSPFKNEIPNWILMYEDGMSLKEIADIYQTSPQTIHKNIKEAVAMRKSSITSREYLIHNPGYMDVIDSHEKAYWLGIWYGTGFISKQPGSFQCTLVVSIRDVDTLERFRQKVGYSKPIQYIEHENFKSARLQFYSKYLYESLISLGFKTNKVSEHHFPIFINDNLYNSFILGYFEGKGTCYQQTIKNKKTKQTKIEFFGNESFLSTLHSIIKEQVGVSMSFTLIKQKKEYKKSCVCKLGTANREKIDKISRWMYQNIEEYNTSRDVREIINHS